MEGVELQGANNGGLRGHAVFSEHPSGNVPIGEEPLRHDVDVNLQHPVSPKACKFLRSIRHPRRELDVQILHPQLPGDQAREQEVSGVR